MIACPHLGLVMQGLLAAAFAAGSPASAQEPLFLRIRPPDAAPREVGAGPSEADRAVARAAREAVWERSAVRARIAIASVCTGCLKPLPPPVPMRPLTGAGASANDPASDPTATPAATPAADPAADPALPTRGDP